MYLLEGYNIKAEKKVRDPIYGFIHIPNEFVSIIDNGLFQRLRWIGQMPLVQLVFPSAQHSRFEHSLGVMHLSMMAAISLIKNSEKEIAKAFKNDTEFNSISGDVELGLSKKDKQKMEFILAAGLAGLLHDIGHAPFSHTLEDAYEYSKEKNLYNHEKIGYKIAVHLVNGINRIYACKALEALNKSKEGSAVVMLIKNLIDGPFDVDKGDYLLRDSYHCGVTYGLYDKEWLWGNIIIVDELVRKKHTSSNDVDSKTNEESELKYKIGIREKAALECWNLRIARFMLYRNIAHHHVRNITDAMLIDAIVTAIDKIKDKKKTVKAEKMWRLLMPFSNLTDTKISREEIDRFILWTDNSLIINLKDILREYGETDAAKSIDSFFERGLPKNILLKRDVSLHITSGLSRREERAKVFNGLKDVRDRLREEEGITLSIFIEKEVVSPVFEEEVFGEENAIWVQDKKDLKKFMKLGDYLEIGGGSLSKIIKIHEDIFLDNGLTSEDLNNVKRSIDDGNLSFVLQPRFFLHIFLGHNTEKSDSTIKTIEKEVDQYLNSKKLNK